MKTALHTAMHNRRGAVSNPTRQPPAHRTNIAYRGSNHRNTVASRRPMGLSIRRNGGVVVILSQSGEVAGARRKLGGRPASRRLRVLAAYKKALEENGEVPTISRLSRLAKVHDFRNTKRTLRELRRRGEIE